MRWRLGEGIAAGTLALLIALFPYRSTRGIVLGVWSLPFAILLGVLLFTFTLTIWVLMRPPVGPVDAPHRRRGSNEADRAVDLAAALWGFGYLIGTIFAPATRARIIALDLLHSEVPAASFLQFAGLAAFLVGVGILLWTRFGGRLPKTIITLCVLIGLVTLAEGVARWMVAYRPQPTEFATATSARWDALHVRLNGAGERDLPHAPDAAARTKRILFVGGDEAFGAGITDPHMRIADQVAARLEAPTSLLWESIDLGEVGARTPEAMEQLQRGLRYHPDFVILLYAMDDIDYLAPRIRPRAPSAGDWQERLDPGYLLFTNSMLVQELCIRHPGWIGGEISPLRDPLADSLVASEHFEDLRRFAALAGDSGRVAGIVPIDIEAASDIHHRGRYRTFVARADSAGLPIWNVEKAWEGKTTAQLAVGPQFLHPNEAASGAIADVIAAQIEAKRP